MIQVPGTFARRMLFVVVGVTSLDEPNFAAPEEEPHHNLVEWQDANEMSPFDPKRFAMKDCLQRVYQKWTLAETRQRHRQMYNQKAKHCYTTVAIVIGD